VFNLGYTPEVAREYPYVAELSGGPSTSSGQAWRRAPAAAGLGVIQPASGKSAGSSCHGLNKAAPLERTSLTLRVAK
jgi:hypothetical protein